jgi:hypothetical protein
MLLVPARGVYQYTLSFEWTSSFWARFPQGTSFEFDRTIMC